MNSETVAAFAKPNIPYPGPLRITPVIGDLLNGIGTFRNQDFRYNLFEKYGDVVRLRYFGNDALLVRGEQNMRKIFGASAPIASSGALLYSLRHIVGTNHMVALDPPRHGNIRGKVRDAFNPKDLARLTPIIMQTVEKNFLSPKIGSLFNLGPVAAHLSFGMVFGLLGYPGEIYDEMYQWWSQLNEALYSLPVIQRAFGRGLKARASIIAKTREAAAAGRITKDSIVDKLWQARQAGSITEIEFDDNVLIIGVAGFGTTSDTIVAFTYHYLTDAAMRADLQRELGAGTQSAALEQAIRQEMPVLESAIKEVLRHSTPVPVVHRRATAPMELSGHPIASGTVLVVCLAETHRDPRSFDSPEQFRHRRWLDVEPPEFAYLPFLRGVHFCLGNQLARQEIRIYATYLVRNMSLRLAENKFVATTVNGGGYLMVERTQ